MSAHLGWQQWPRSWLAGQPGSGGAAAAARPAPDTRLLAVLAAAAAAAAGRQPDIIHSSVSFTTCA